MAKKDTTNYQQGDEGDVRFWLPPEHNGKPQVLTKARKRRGDVVKVETDRGGREFRSLAIPLNWYVAHRNITGEEYEAGTRLHALWRGSILYARYATMRLGDGPGAAFDGEGAALMPRDYFRAMDAVQGFHPKRLVRQVCCFEALAGDGMRWLKDGLGDLVRHFDRGIKK